MSYRVGRVAFLIAPLVVLGSSVTASAREVVRPPEKLVPATYEAPPSGAAGVDLDRWWRLFKDPALDALEDEAARNAPDALTAAARVMEARANLSSQIAQTLPTGKITGNASRQKQDNIGARSNSLLPIGGVYEAENATFSPSWEIDLFGRLAAARKVANAAQAQTRFNVEGARASLAASVADSYFQVAGLVIQVEDAKETARIDLGLERVARDKADLGLGARSDADQVAGQRAQAEAQVEELQAQLHAARRNLLILIGRGAAPTGDLHTAPELGEAPLAPNVLPGDLLVRRPDVREAEARLRAQIGTGTIRHLAIYPTFTFLPQLGLTRTVQPSVGFNPATQALFPISQTTSLGFWTWGGSVTVPLFDIPRLLFDAKAEDARTRQAAIAYEKTVQTAYGEAENALNTLAAGKRATAILTIGESQAKSASDAANTRYAMGLDDLTSALSAEQSWRATHAALTGERVQTLRQAVAVYKALGGGWSPTPRSKTS